MSSPPSRHPAPAYEEDEAADPYVYDDDNEPAYDDPNCTSEDPNPRFADEEERDADEDLAMMLPEGQGEERDPEVAADIARYEGDIDAPEDGGDDWLEAGRDEESTRREMAEREDGYEREELDDTYDFEED